MYRHELKYIINDGMAQILAARLKTLCRPDRHADESGRYRVSSLYFDDFCNTAVTDNLIGHARRKKFRIRIYNGSDAFIRLERKQKNGWGCQKESALLSRRDCERLMDGQTLSADGASLHGGNAVLRDFALMERTRLLRPRVIVDYIREAYIYEPGNVRVTMDRGVRAAVGTVDLFSGDAAYAPAFGPGDVILEIKYTGFLPGPIAALTQCAAVRQSASKYSQCRLAAQA
jgi:hypothetical protein